MVTRIGGMASGMDTASIVKSLMDAERLPLIKLERKEQQLEWKQDDYREMNVKLKNLFDSVDPLRLQGSFTVSNPPTETEKDEIITKIKKFVDTYNEVTSAIHGKIKEDRHADYQPLTNDERDAMSDKQADRWDAKARSGMLRNDSMLQGILTEMRSELSNPLAGATDTNFDTLSEIGISVKGSYHENGKLTLDETKLRDILSTTSGVDAVKELFTKAGTTTNENGIAKRVLDTLNIGMKKISQTAGSAGSVPTGNTIGKELLRLSKQMANFNQRLAGIEDRYWKQFTAMEKAMSQMNSQSAWLYQQFG
ncbi:flagellar filament capping protein FliD [Domibacillus iocasae]|uniref:Filament cap protein n=1 Tax=Domibacillus iocasae TaxID=1714016 RepID=A0A1E7DQX2_9BACI|nr:flagellar filament capping protein FliD [Domibacillus iocasae]OES45461.1 hypothetical protein BA724_17580 [Domibacillus iocasae]